MIKRAHNVEVCKYGKGQLIGEEEFLNRTKANHSVVCDTLHGELIAIKFSEFQKKVIRGEEGIKTLV